MGVYKLKPWQSGFIKSDRRFPALVAAVGTGKTLAAIMKMKMLMDRYPKNLGLVVRREFTDLKDSTIKDFTRYTGIDVPSSKDVVFPNGSTILFRHGDDISLLKNINLGAIYVEQAEEFETDETFTFLRDRLRRQEAAVRQLFIIANTNGHNWIHKLWKVNAERDPEFELFEATTFDNAENLPADFIEDLRKQEHTHPEHYRRYVMNSWDDVDTVDIIIRPEWVRQAVNRELREKHYTRKVVVCDPARFGDDETVIYVLENGEIIDSEVYTQKSAMETCGWMIKMSEKHQIKDIALDVCGMGAPMFDRLIELNRQVVPVNSSESATDRNRYRNVRAEMWHRAAELFEAGEVSIPNDEILIEQLSGVRYKTIESNGRFQVESKEDIKSPKRLGTSPDRADCLVMGLWALDRVQATYRKDYGLKSQKKASYGFNPMTV